MPIFARIQYPYEATNRTTTSQLRGLQKAGY